ncbi:hypothetical protein ACQ4PT_049751 [Festuca glaucescens]
MDMVRKVFNVPSGNRHVDLINRSVPCQLRDVYKQDNPRPPIKNDEKVLLAYEDTDEETIVRSWDLLVLTTVLNPCTGNMLCMDYLGSLAEPFSSVELAWDQHILDECMLHVQKIQEKKAKLRSKGVVGGDFWISGHLPFLGIVYMDHLEFPPNEYVIDYSLPRACHVKSKDFEFVVATDIDKKKLFNITIFARRLFLTFSKTPYAQVAQPAETAEEVEVNPLASLNEWIGPAFLSSQELEVPARYKHLYDKHKAIYAADVDATIKNLVVGLKCMYSQRMSALLVDVDAIIRERDGPSLVFASATNGEQNTNPNVSSEEHDAAKDGEVAMDEADDDNDDDAEADVDFHADEVEDYPEVHARSGIPDVPQPVILVDSSCKGGYTGEMQCVDSPVRSLFRSSIPRGISAEEWNRALDPPSMDLFSPGSEEFVDFNRIPDSPSHNSVATAGDDTVVPSVQKPAAVSTVEKPPVVEKTASVEKHAAVSAVEKPPAMEKPAAVATVEKPPAATTEAEASIQNLVIVVDVDLGEPKTPVGPKSANVIIIDSVEKDATTGVDTVDKRNRAKRAAKDELTPPKMKKIRLKLIVDPVTFNPNECMKDFKSAVSQFKMLKDDLLYFPVVKDYHWIVCCVNLVHKQYHIFDSLLNADGSSKLQDAANNLFTNFRRLVNESGVAKIDWPMYNLTTPDHPQQSTTFDCGFFSVMYMDQFNGKVMTDFDDKVIPDLRKYLAASLINNRDNAELVDKLMDAELQVK